MTNNNLKSIVFLMLVAGRKQKEELLEALTQAGGRMVNAVYGRGSVQTNYLMDILGLIPEEHKVVITCMLPSEKSDDVLEMLINKFNFDKPNTGIAFTVPIDKISL